jgi:hypothetical protein
MPGATVDPWWLVVSQAPELNGPVVANVPLDVAVTLKVPFPLSTTV